MFGENFVGKDELQAILNKGPLAITDGEKAILAARISYLTDEEKRTFGLNEEEGGLTDMSVKELKGEAAEKGIDIKGLKTKEEIIETIEAGLKEDKD